MSPSASTVPLPQYKLGALLQLLFERKKGAPTKCLVYSSPHHSPKSLAVNNLLQDHCYVKGLSWDIKAFRQRNLKQGKAR